MAARGVQHVRLTRRSHSSLLHGLSSSPAEAEASFGVLAGGSPEGAARTRGLVRDLTREGVVPSSPSLGVLSKLLVGNLAQAQGLTFGCWHSRVRQAAASREGWPSLLPGSRLGPAAPPLLFPLPVSPAPPPLLPHPASLLARHERQSIPLHSGTRALSSAPSPSKSAEDAVRVGTQAAAASSSAVLLPLPAAAAAGGGGAGAGASVLSGLREAGVCYYQLSKTRLSLLVAATAGAGFIMGSGEAVDWAACTWTCAGTFLAAASANSLNQMLEVKSDAAMKRTMRRPLPTSRMSMPHALLWAAATGFTGVFLLLPLTLNPAVVVASQPSPPFNTASPSHSSPSPDTSTPGTARDSPSSREAQEQAPPPPSSSSLPAALAAANILLYAGVYTPLKRLHPLNTLVGAVVGAIPPLIGWSAASHQGLLDLRQSAGAWVWAAVLFFWQMPHFFALSWLCRDDYARVGYKMLSVLDPSGRRTAAAALRHSAFLLPLGPLTYASGVATAPFALEASLLSAAYAAAAAPFYAAPTQTSARRLFRASLLFLPAYMAAMTFHRIPHSLPASALSEQHLHAPAPVLGQASGVGAKFLGMERVTVSVSSRDGSQDEERGSRLLAVRESSAGRRMDPHVLPPAAYASAAPFPFLPLPH